MSFIGAVIVASHQTAKLGSVIVVTRIVMSLMDISWESLQILMWVLHPRTWFLWVGLGIKILKKILKTSLLPKKTNRKMTGLAP